MLSLSQGLLNGPLLFVNFSFSINHEGSNVRDKERNDLSMQYHQGNGKKLPIERTITESKSTLIPT
jgi:hypothetical protein